MFDLLQHPPRTPEQPRVAAGVSVAAHAALILVLALGTSEAVVRTTTEQSIVEAAIRFLLPPDKPGNPASEARAQYATQRTGTENPSTFSVPNGRPVPLNTGANAKQDTDGSAPQTLAEAAAAQSAFTLIDVDSGATRDPDSAAPTYPPDLAARNIEGMAIVRFVVDTTGRADLESFQLIDTNHPAFGAAVRAALPGMKFRAAMIGTKPVRQLVEQPFVFKLTKP